MHEKSRGEGDFQRKNPSEGRRKATSKKLSAKTLRKMTGLARALVQLAFFFLAPGAFTAAFAGAKYLFTQFGKGEPLALNPFVAFLIGLCAFTLVFGRFFCGFACPFGAVGDWIHALYVFICRKRKKAESPFRSGGAAFGMCQIPRPFGASFAELPWTLRPDARPESLGRLFDAHREESSPGGLRGWLRPAFAHRGGDVLREAVLLPGPLPDGGDFLAAAGAADFCPPAFAEVLRPEMFSLHEYLSLGHRAAGGRAARCFGRLLPMPEMHGKLPKNKHTCRLLRKASRE